MTQAINSVFVLKKTQGYDDIPLSPNPFFVLAKEGSFLRATSALGVGTIKVDGMPKNLGEVGNPKGWFDFKAPPIPAEICAQIVSFFRRIWDKHQAEAEVLLTARIEVIDGYPTIKEWRVFIPTQKVSMGGVDSVYEPTHIAKGHQVVGTMHSHCNFGAYHSGTDTGDAKGMNGLHLTIGHVDKEKPQIVSMVSMNGINIDFDPEVVADFSNLKAATAPAWWDNYVLPSKDVVNSDKIIGFNNFDRYKRDIPAWKGNSSPPYNYYGNRGNYGGYDDASYYGNRNNYGGQSNFGFGSRPPDNTTPAVATKTLKEIQEEDQKAIQQAMLLPADTRSLKPINTEVVASKKEDDAADDIKRYSNDEDYWEDNMDEVLRDILFDNQLLTDDDIGDIIQNKENLTTFLRALLVHKLVAARRALNLMGVEVQVQVLKKPKFRKKKGKIINGRRN